MITTLCYFEIPVTDLDRAAAFYEHVFGVRFERGEIDGNEMAFFGTADIPGAPAGALAKGDSYVPGRSGVRVYFATDDIDAAICRATDAGGRILYPVTSIGELGWVAEFEDTEGNCVALHQAQDKPRRT
jgi:uncharacterized protein